VRKSERGGERESACEYGRGKGRRERKNEEHGVEEEEEDERLEEKRIKEERKKTGRKGRKGRMKTRTVLPSKRRIATVRMVVDL